MLAPLGGDQAEEMVNGLLGQSGLTAAMRARVTAAAEGNPLFVEQLVSMLIDEGGTGAGTTAAEMRIPPTIEALVAARLDGSAMTNAR